MDWWQASIDQLALDAGNGELLAHDWALIVNKWRSAPRVPAAVRNKLKEAVDALPPDELAIYNKAAATYL